MGAQPSTFESCKDSIITDYGSSSKDTPIKCFDLDWNAIRQGSDTANAPYFASDNPLRYFPCPAGSQLFVGRDTTQSSKPTMPICMTTKSMQAMRDLSGGCANYEVRPVAGTSGLGVVYETVCKPSVPAPAAPAVASTTTPTTASTASATASTTASPTTTTTPAATTTATPATS